jgi:ABC-type nitrate/sulfonate/bicarbonate transport system substrate-binding protein
VGGVPEHFNEPWYLAVEAGAFAATGTPIDWIDQPGGTGQMTTGLADGDLDVAVALTEGVVAAIANGLDAAIVDTYVSSPLQWGVHVAAESPHERIADLATARVAVSRHGSGSHLMAHVMADRAGFTLSDDRLVVVGGIDGAARALPAGEADVFLWDRSMTQPLVDAGILRRIAVEPTPWPAFVVAARADVIRERAAELRTVLVVAATSAALFARRPDRALLVTRRHGLAADVAEAWARSTDFAPLGAPDGTTIDDVVTTLAGLGLIDHRPRADGLVRPLP